MVNLAKGFQALGAGLGQMAGSRMRQTEKELDRLHDENLQRIREKYATARRLESEERADVRYGRRLGESREYAEQRATEVGSSQRSREDFKEFRKEINSLKQKHIEAAIDPIDYVKSVQSLLQSYDIAGYRPQMGELAISAFSLVPEGTVKELPDIIIGVRQAYGGGQAGATPPEMATQDTSGFSLFPDEMPQIPQSIQEFGQTALGTAQRIGQKSFEEAGRDVGSAAADLFGKAREAFGRFATTPKPRSSYRSQPRQGIVSPDLYPQLPEL